MGPDSLLALARWTSPAFPTGGFVWSHGLEAAIAAGDVSSGRTLEHWLATILGEGAGRSDAILLFAACRAVPDDVPALADLAEALCPTAERRAETLGQGTAFAAALAASDGLILPPMPYPVALGRAARLAGLPSRPLAALHLQAVASNLVQVALRLMPLGQSRGAGILARLGPLAVRVAGEAESASLDDLGTAAPAIDLASMRHETLASRMFRS